jgi:hypothetical protein
MAAMMVSADVVDAMVRVGLTTAQARETLELIKANRGVDLPMQVARFILDNKPRFGATRAMDAAYRICAP